MTLGRPASSSLHSVRHRPRNQPENRRAEMRLKKARTKKPARRSSISPRHQKQQAETSVGWLCAVHHPDRTLTRGKWTMDDNLS